jgi:hypothetical protein
LELRCNSTKLGMKRLVKIVKVSVHENVIFSQAAVRFLVGQPWRNKHGNGKASPLAWFVLRGARAQTRVWAVMQAAIDEQTMVLWRPLNPSIRR